MNEYVKIHAVVLSSLLALSDPTLSPEKRREQIVITCKAKLKNEIGHMKPPKRDKQKKQPNIIMSNWNGSKSVDHTPERL